MNKKARLAAAALVVVLGAGFYATPYITVAQMRSAAQAKDADKLSRYVDFPALRENLKTTFNEKINAQIAQSKDASPFGALGAAVAGALINPMVDAMVTPQSLSMIVQGQQPKGEKPQEEAIPAADAASKPEDSSTDVSMGYEGFDQFAVNIKHKDSGEPVSLIFHREGLISWKLAALRLPM
ncbi:DUF2939 domain-containing protein [Uliginosibacterium gangwonense]|uniref:DUF2939 domain-containing protein n=1 Tax=Uliginosibacterium gangwonense TaxID=392736 RepID=UPI00037CD77F|nr:DUF2939 domain-containing protein [Uliginosibacterium gangwonense]